ncbi:MAG: EamA family transporter [Candidatus Margulisiibacteriota bacterium]|nr:EamA family transporter [Candidatus Margulisiibacteriota bacterium]
MHNLLFWIIVYTLILAYSQVLLKIGVSHIGGIGFDHPVQFFLSIFSNVYIISGTILMASSYFLWLAILSWFKLSVAFPLTAIGFIFVAVLSYFILNEKLLFINYVGILFIALGIFLLLYKSV